ncbi:hypothetical protein CC78DRAFT_618276 [Lojkania enalia]|uniref:Inner centromere protein ARK-binding domain-containing protein n=1 Tax=Lojkania enalia TaxID=147567 RepID=A0A9P4K7G6_9PLEO|nr:hypothetical protein CC78DRAFT_618276 [Didymosphaeria enalia]
MAAARSKTPAIGSAPWILDERHQSNDLVAQELEDFGFSVRNELEWLNEHMADVFAHNGQNNLDVYKTPGKLRGKTPRTARKKNALEARQPLGDIFAANAQKHPSPAQQSLQKNLQKNPAKAKFRIAEDTENVAPMPSSATKSPIPRPLFTKPLDKGKENHDARYPDTSEDELPEDLPRVGLSRLPPHWSPMRSTQDTIPDMQETQIFTQESIQSTQPTQMTQSLKQSMPLSEEERRDTGDSFVSAKEDFASKHASKENLREHFHADTMDIDFSESLAQGTAIKDDTQLNAQGVVNSLDLNKTPAHDTVISTESGSMNEDATVIRHPKPTASPREQRLFSEQYSISADTQQALNTAAHSAFAPVPRNLALSLKQDNISNEMDTGLNAADSQDGTVIHHKIHNDSALDHTVHEGTVIHNIEDGTVIHHNIDDQMDVDDDVRSPSDGSSPVKPLVRKSSLTFASLPAREPLLAKKSMGNRISRTSQIDQSKARNSQMGRFTGGKSLGGSQYRQVSETHHYDMNVDEDRREPRQEESTATKMHNKTSTMRLAERINMLNQKNDPPKRISQNVTSSQPSQGPSLISSQPLQNNQPSQQTYSQLPPRSPEKDDDDEWISPIRTTAPPPNPVRPILSKSYSADTQLAVTKGNNLSKPITVSNPDLSTVVESTTPAGSPTGKRNMDGPLSASKAKLYSAFRAAKEKIIGSSAISAQVKLDALIESPTRPQLHPTASSDDIFSPKRNEKAGTSIFSHLRSPSKESVKSTKSTKASVMTGSPTKDEGPRTRSSSERERQREKDAREKESKQKQRTEERLKEIREKEQSKAAAHYQKTKAAAKTPVSVSQQSGARLPAAVSTKTPMSALQQASSRPGATKMNSASRHQDHDSADEMPPPPPPKSLLPTGPGHKLREPKRLVKAPSKDALSKPKPPQIIKVNLGRTLNGTMKPVPATSSKAAPPAPPPAPKSTTATSKPGHSAYKAVPAAAPKPAPVAKLGPPAPKPARIERPQPQKVMEKPKPAPAQSRADLGGARPVSRMQTIQDANRINIPPINPAKPAKRPLQPENDDALHRPAKRPSQLAKSKPVTPAHAQFAQGRIPFAESSQPSQPAIQYPKSEEIKLPDIMTDSEDEDSENDFEPPDWVNTPNLREMLEKQQLMDPEQIFGPIAPLNMEQMFPNKERHKKFRDRTSSAHWANDEVTEEEKRKEREARERLVRNGAWTYHPSPGPSTQR